MRHTKGSATIYFEDENGENPSQIAGVIEASFDYNYFPAEKMIRYLRDGSGYPGCDASHEIYNLKAISIDDMKLDDNQSKIIADWLESRIDEQVQQAIGEDLEKYQDWGND